ncbi:ABC transporter substrate-binding protein [Saccharobesus litoralis]|uniref:ABC transporter substrate-binding protein n=1 Tax=Saccharobesus litoralis TaxID=2172099 RepID=A0A2S0VSB9_9ALTE|nr:ABC transporter substrate-binding protein [Saccharobesus litoralis]AWB67097.1 ABC transporter substrate-binding protein [Saccharobesus litoralis]
MNSLALFSALLIALLLTGCKPPSSSILEKGLIYCSEGSPETFNPQLVTSATTLDAISRQLYNRLLEFDPVDGSLQPSLAEYWQVSEDGLTYTFKLRDNVAFHSTRYFTPSRPFNAKDVLFSFKRWFDIDHPFHHIGGGIYPYFDSIQISENIQTIEAVSSKVIRLKLYRADSSFLSHFATDYAAILSAEYADHLLEKNTPELIDMQPVGTGPYILTHYQKDAYIRFKRHVQYWQTKGNIENLVFDITSQSSLRLAKLITRECDVIAYPVTSEMAILNNEDKVSLQAQPAINVGFWAFNTLKAPFDNPNVRRALAAAIDKQTILKAVYYGSASEANSILPPFSWAYQAPKQGNKPNASYNPDLAKRLLSEAGIKPGFTMDIWAMPIERAYNPNARKMAELIKENLKEVGIKVKIVSYEWNTFRRLLSEQKHDSVLIGWAADTPEPDNFFSPILSCASAIVGSNRAAWCNTEFDETISQALTVEGRENRKRYYAKAQKILDFEMPVVPIAHSTRYLAKQDNVYNINFSPYSSIGFSQVEKNQ